MKKLAIVMALLLSQSVFTNNYYALTNAAKAIVKASSEIDPPNQSGYAMDLNFGELEVKNKTTGEILLSESRPLPTFNGKSYSYMINTEIPRSQLSKTISGSFRVDLEIAEWTPNSSYSGGFWQLLKIYNGTTNKSTFTIYRDGISSDGYAYLNSTNIRYKLSQAMPQITEGIISWVYNSDESSISVLVDDVRIGTPIIVPQIGSFDSFEIGPYRARYTSSNIKIRKLTISSD